MLLLQGNKLVKFGGGFYCGLIDTVKGKDPVYVMNGIPSLVNTRFLHVYAIQLRETRSIYLLLHRGVGRRYMNYIISEVIWHGKIFVGKP